LLYRLLWILTLAAAASAPSSAAAARPVISQPYDLLPLRNGAFLVTDLPRNAVYELDPAHKTGRLVARVRQARELCPLPGGRVLVSSGARVLALDLRTRKTALYATARNYLLGIALAPDGWLYGSENVFGSGRRRSSGSAAARARCSASSTASTASSSPPTASS
jgi:hypothetical protein